LSATKWVLSESFPQSMQVTLQMISRVCLLSVVATHLSGFAAAAADRQFFDAFSSNIQDPASVQMVVLTFLLFCSVWELVICMTTGPALGPILRGIIQVSLHTYF
jgi:hypothetical protein